jgi:hypothetical protein
LCEAEQAQLCLRRSRNVAALVWRTVHAANRNDVRAILGNWTSLHDLALGRIDAMFKLRVVEPSIVAPGQANCARSQCSPPNGCRLHVTFQPCLLRDVRGFLLRAYQRSRGTCRRIRVGRFAAQLNDDLTASVDRRNGACSWRQPAMRQIILSTRASGRSP